MVPVFVLVLVVVVVVLVADEDADVALLVVDRDDELDDGEVTLLPVELDEMLAVVEAPLLLAVLVDPTDDVGEGDVDRLVLPALLEEFVPVEKNWPWKTIARAAPPTMRAATETASTLSRFNLRSFGDSQDIRFVKN